MQPAEVAQAVLKATVGSYASVRADYWARVYDAVEGYLRGSGSVTSSQNELKQAVVEAYTAAVEAGYQDGGAELPLDEDTDAWLTAQMNDELSYVSSMFQEMRGLRNDPDFNPTEDPISTAFAKAELWAQSLDQIYSEAKVRAAGNQMLTFAGSDGKVSCDTCQRLKGERHRASWWVSHGLVPGAGNSNYDCSGYRCRHYLEDDNGNLFTI